MISLRSSAHGAFVLWLASSIAALLALSRLLMLGVPADIGLAVLAFMLILISVPAVDWIYTWWDVVRSAVRAAWRAFTERLG